MAANVSLIALLMLAGFTAHHAPLIGATPILFGYAACFFPYAALLWCVKRRGYDSFWAIAGIALLIRLALIFADPVLSDDIFRYVWEGRVSLNGFNPFALAPDAAELSALRDEVIWPRVNHPEISAIYPPLSQYVFALVAALGGGATSMRFLFVLVEVAGIAAVCSLVDRSDPRLLFGFAIYALNPLVMLEVAWSGHLDVLAWVPLTIALVILVARPPTARWGATSGALIGLSIGAKLLGLLILPYLALRSIEGGWRRTLGHRAAIVVVALGVAGSSYAGFADAGPKLFGGFGTYAASWRSNDGLFRAFDALSWYTLQQGDAEERIFRFGKWDDVALAHGFTKEWEGETLPNTSFTTNQISQTVAKALALLVVLLVLGWCIISVRDPVVAVLAILLALYFVAPTVHPWYVAWLIPLAALRPSPTAIVFSCAVLAGYVPWLAAETGGAWAMPWWVAAAEYGLVSGVLLWEVGARLRSCQVTTLSSGRRSIHAGGPPLHSA